MFENIGKKIMTLAEVVTWLGIVGSIIYGFVVMAQDEDLVIVGILTMILGSVGSWIGSFLLYGFGQLIENSEELIRLMKVGNAYTRGIESNTSEDEYEEEDDEEYDDEPAAPPKPSNYIPPIDVSAVSFWRCSGCGKTITTDQCPFCGASAITASVFFEEEETEAETEAPISDEDAITNAFLSHDESIALKTYADEESSSEEDAELDGIGEYNETSMPIKICRCCGAILHEDCLYCTSCGTKL